MKKILTFLFTLLLVFGVAACGGNNNNSNNNDQETDASHEHTYAEEWSKNATHHWHAATCGHTSEVSDKAEHTWDEGVVTIEPTATEKGEKKFTCTVCAVTKNVTIDELGTEEEHEHTYSEEWSSDETYHWHAATCEHTTEVSDKDEHDWDEGKVTKEPTVDAKGEKTFACTVCEETKVEELDKLTPAEEREIEVDYENGVLYVPTERDLRVAQFADAHFGVDGNNWHNDKLERSKEYMRYIVETTKPDFIVCSGDNVIGTGIVNTSATAHDLTEFVEFMESLETPWTFMYGNHDAETKSKLEYSQFLLQCIEDGTTKYLVYKEDHIEVADTSYSTSDEGRYGNFTIPVYDIDNKTNLLGAYIFLDAGTYLYDLSKYQTITAGQIAWYESEINRLQAIYSVQDGNAHEVVPTIIFSHIQLPQHKTGYSSAYKQDGLMNAEFVIRQDDVSGELVDKAAEEESGMFEKMVELGSTKAYFVGHAHSYYFQVKVDGIVLGYAPQCGFSKLFETNDNPRYTYVYNVSKDFAFTTTNVVEQEDLGEGLVAKYFDGTNGDSIHEATYDSETGLYTMTVKMQKQWARIRFYFNNEVISTADSTYTFAGDYQTGCDTASLKLYPGSNPENLFYPNAAISEYTFTFDPETKTLTVKAPEPKEVDVDGLYCVYTNPDNVVTEATVATADTNGNYVFEVYLKAWRYVQLYYDGVMLSTSNTTIEGLYYNSTSTDWGINLYWSPSVSNALAAGQFGGTYIFIYNPTTKTLTIGMDGLLYNGSEIADYNSSTKTYTFNLQPAVGDKLTLDYDGAALSGSDLTITGAFSTATSGVTGNVYYQKDASTNEFYCAGEGTFIVTYNATTKTLNFEYVEQNGLTYTTRYNGTTDANPVEYEATANSDGTYTINFEFSKAWAYINFTYNGVALTTSNTTFTYTGLAGIYVDGGKSIMCNTTAEALRAYVITYDPVAKTLTMAAA